MSNNIGGFEYENTVIDALVAAGVNGTITEGAGSSSADADADFIIGGKRYLIEVKKNSEAQMGGTSVKYIDSEFSFASDDVDETTREIIIETLEDKVFEIEDLLCKIGCEQFPAKCTKEVWEQAKNDGYLIPVNEKVEFDTDFIVDHYNAKGINYIQIGGAGLFYLGENPASLPIPELSGKINIELRAGRSGSKKGKVSAGLRAQGRLQFKGTSPYTLDDPASIKEMLKEKNV